MKRQKIIYALILILFFTFIGSYIIDNPYTGFSLFNNENNHQNNNTFNLANQEKTIESTFGVGSGIVWPDRYFAPFVDITTWVSDSKYSSNGSLDLVKMYNDTGVPFYNVGFIGSSRDNYSLVEGQFGPMIDWTFGGYGVLSERSSDKWQYNGIKNSIKGLRALGGDVTISVGGGIEYMNFFQRTQDVEILKNTYLDIIYGFGLTKLDLDIEGLGQGKSINVANAKAIKMVQDITGVDIILTVPVVPTGLTSQGIGILDAYLEQGVDIDIVNIMTMCYGTDTLRFGESYGKAAIRATENLKDQIKARYKAVLGITLTDKQAYAKIGTTISIGYQSSAYPIYTTNWAQKMYDYAVEKDIKMLSFWSLNRDSKTIANIGVNNRYEFTEIYKGYTMNYSNEENTEDNNTIDYSAENQLSLILRAMIAFIISIVSYIFMNILKRQI